MTHWRPAEARLIERVFERPKHAIKPPKTNHLSVLAECLEEILESHGFRNNGKSILGGVLFCP